MADPNDPKPPPSFLPPTGAIPPTHRGHSALSVVLPGHVRMNDVDSASPYPAAPDVPLPDPGDADADEPAADIVRGDVEEEPQPVVVSESLPGPPAPESHTVKTVPRGKAGAPADPTASGVAPVLSSPVRKVRLIVRKIRDRLSVHIGPIDEAHAWVKSSRPVGRAIVVGGKLVAAYAAARVHSYTYNHDDNCMDVKVDLAFVPFGDEEIEVEGRMVPLRTAWWNKYHRQDRGELQKLFEAELVTLLERVELDVHLVLRFVGGPPMDEDSAKANGYQFWLNGVRSPVRVEIDRRPANSLKQQQLDVYHSVWLLPFWWRWTNPEKYDLYRKGEALAKGKTNESVPAATYRIGAKELQDMLTVVASNVSRVVQSMSSLLFASDPTIAAELEDRKRRMEGTRIERPGTYLTYAGDPEEAE